MYWCGNNKRKSRWSMRLLGPGIVIGHESLANVWTCHRIAVVKVVGNHVRLAEVEEQLPWRDLYDPLCHTDEQTYVDLCPLGASRNPQYEGPSTSSDAPMTPTPVADESTPDATASEPDTSGIPVLPKHPMHAPVRKPRVPWRSDALGVSTPQAAQPVVSPQNVPATTPPWPTPMSVFHAHLDTQPETPLPTPN